MPGANTPLADLPYIEWVEPDTGATQRLYADANTDETQNLPATVTEYPVEVGSTRTDNFRKDPETMHLDMFFSGSPVRHDLDPDYTATNTTYPMTPGQYPPGAPIYTPGGLLQATKGAVGLIGAALFGGDGQPSSFTAYAFATPPFGRYQKAIQTIRRLQSMGILVAAKNTTERLENMAILNAQGHRNAQTGDGAELALDLKEIVFVSSDISFSSPTPTEARAIPKKTGVNAGGGTAASGAELTALKGFMQNVLPKLLPGG